MYVIQEHDIETGKVASDLTFSEKITAGMDHFLDSSHLIQHVQDANYFEVPKFMGEKIYLPSFMTKFMVLELAAAVLLLVAFTWVTRKASTGERPTGRLWNLLEAFVVFIRDNIARPSIGTHDANRFLPFLLTLFCFILTLNVFGMIPFLGSATGSISVTAVFALITFVVVVGSGMKKMGVVGFLKAQVPHLEMPKYMAVVLIPGIWLLEFFGLFIKHFVLSIRLFANMFGGHLVLAVFVGLIGAVSATSLFWGVAPIVVLASLALSVLELFVAFLQAYVFTFLAALFIGSAQHAH